jgi:hypothetical protein
MPTSASKFFIRRVEEPIEELLVVLQMQGLIIDSQPHVKVKSRRLTTLETVYTSGSIDSGIPR